MCPAQILRSQFFKDSHEKMFNVHVTNKYRPVYHHELNSPISVSILASKISDLLTMDDYQFIFSVYHHEKTVFCHHEKKTQTTDACYVKMIE